MTSPVTQVSKLFCQPDFLQNLTGFLPTYLPSNLHICLKHSIRVGSAEAFRVWSCRTTPLDPLPQGNAPHGFQPPMLVGSSGIFAILEEGALLSGPDLQLGLQGLRGFLLGLGPSPVDGLQVLCPQFWFPPWCCQKAVTPQGP